MPAHTCTHLHTSVSRYVDTVKTHDTDTKHRHSCVEAPLCMHSHKCTHVCTDTCTHLHTLMCTLMHGHTHSHAHIRMHTHMHKHSYMHIHVHTHPMHTHMHTHMPAQMLSHAWNMRIQWWGHPFLPWASLRTVRPTMSRVARLTRGPDCWAPWCLRASPSAASAAASWALGLAWLVGEALRGWPGPSWAARRARCCYNAQGQSKFRLVQVSGVLGDPLSASLFS